MLLARFNYDYDDPYWSDDGYHYKWQYKAYPDEVEERPTSVPTLQEIATVKVAFALWNRARMMADNYKWQDSLIDEVSEWIEALPVPKLFVNSIALYVKRVNKNFINWARHLLAVLLDETSEKSEILDERSEISKSYVHVDHIMWHPNGRINLVETARNLLKSDKLNNMQKFHLSSAYCLQEEIKNLWPMLEMNDFCDSHLLFHSSPLSCYWHCFCDSKLELIDYEEFELIIKLIRDKIRAVNWAAIEYFFDRLNTEQQVTAAVRLIDEFGLRFQKLVLMKLNESQRVSVFEKKIIDIICNYAESERDNEEDAIAAWYEFRDLITQDQFVSLFTQLLSFDSKDLVLTEIWNSSPDGFKHHILRVDYGDYDFIGYILDWLSFYNWCKYIEPGLTFVSSVLSYSNRACVDIKQRGITKNSHFIKCCLQLIFRSNLESLDKFLNLVLLDAAASTDFKQSLLRSPYFNIYCEVMIILHKFQKLVKLFDFGFSITDPSSTQFLREMLFENMKLLDDWCLECYSAGNLKQLNATLAPLRSSYPVIVTEYKKNLLLSGKGLRMCVNHFVSKDCILPRIIADGVPADLAAEFKRKIISLPEAIDKLKSMMVNKRSNTAMKLIDWYIESKRARNKIKKLLEMAYLREMKRRIYR